MGERRHTPTQTIGKQGGLNASELPYVASEGLPRKTLPSPALNTALH